MTDGRMLKRFQCGGRRVLTKERLLLLNTLSETFYGRTVPQRTPTERLPDEGRTKKSLTDGLFSRTPSWILKGDEKVESC